MIERAVTDSGAGIIITDPNLPDNPIVYVNPAFERMTGYSSEEVLGRNCRFLQEPDGNEEQLERLREALRRGQECRVVLRNHRKDGSSFWNEVHVSPVRDEEDLLVNFVGIQRDVTWSKQAEEERDSSLARERAAHSRLALLAASGRALSSSLDYEATLRGVPCLFVPALADCCLLDLAEDDGSVSRAAEAYAPGAEPGVLNRFWESRALEDRAEGVLASGRSVLVEEAPRDSKDGKLYSYMRVPLIARGKTLGAVTLLSSPEGRRHSSEDLSLAEDLAYRCALAIDNARLYGERSYIAHTLQQSLLPRLPEIPGIEVAAVYRPVGEANEVGGDFYDLLSPRGEGGAWIAVIGDVCGSGAVAAAITALARYTIRAVAPLEDKPSGILSGLNEAMIRQLPNHQFCTAACLRLESDGEGLDISLSCGGHPEPLLLRADGSLQELSCPSKALGVFDDADFSDQTARLGPGDSIVLYTDGVTEARSPDGSFFGEKKLHSLLRSCAGLTAPAIARKMEGEICNFQDGYPHDDLAILVIRVPEND